MCSQNTTDNLTTTSTNIEIVLLGLKLVMYNLPGNNGSLLGLILAM